MGRDHIGNIGVERRIILKLILKTEVVGSGLYPSGSGERRVANISERGNKSWGSVKGGNIFRG
jgi:hypothetical protein